jgi:hypothetical protein
MQNRKATIVEVVQYRVTGDFAVQFFLVSRRVDSKPVHTIPLLEYEAREIAAKLGIEVQLRTLPVQPGGKVVPPFDISTVYIDKQSKFFPQ